MKDFGVIVGCCNQDYNFAEGVCASIRYFMEDVPICLLVDGISSVEIRAMERTYGVSVLNHINISSEFLKKHSFGWALNKMICFWESPWEHFLYMDSDTNAWGNILNKVPHLKEYDMIIDQPAYEYSDADICKWFFDLPRLEKHFPDFNWKAHRNDYVCPGVIFGRRNIFSLDEYKELIEFNSLHPGIFKMGDMGFLNFLIFRAVDEGRLKLCQQDIQFLMPDFDLDYVKKRFPFDENGPVCTDEDVTLIHWAGPKPAPFSTTVYGKPMDFFRRKFLHDAWNSEGLAAEAVIKAEDLKRYYFLYRNKIRKKLKQFKAKLAQK